MIQDNCTTRQTPPFGGDRHDVTIIGGGMVGLTLAIALAREGMNIALVEQGTLSAQLEPEFDGRVSAIALGSQRIFENIGVWDTMREYAEPITDIRVSDGGAPIFLHYQVSEVGGEAFGTIIENRYIRYALVNALRQHGNIRLFENASLESFAADDLGVSATLSSGQQIRSRLLVGADGKNSRVRKLAGIGAVEWAYKQTAIVCTIEHENPHHGLAQERFLPAGPFACLPMRGNRSSLVWVEPDERVALYMELSDGELAQEISERVGDYLGKITVSGKRFSYPLSLQHAKTYIGKRLVLIGDAAHAMHPVAGQGVNIGFRDVAALAELVTEQYKLGLDIGGDALLTRYERWRRTDSMLMLAVTDGLVRLFSNEMIPIKAARGLGMWAVGKMPPLKRFFMRHAMGVVGDVPRLMRK